MKSIFVVFAICISGLSMAAEYDVKDLKISTEDFVDNKKISIDGRCTMKMEKWTSSPFTSLYIYDRDDNMYQGSIAFAQIVEGATTVVAADEINENCSLNSDSKNVDITCRGFGFRETVKLKVNKQGLIKEITHIERGAGIAGHSIPFPYIKNKKLTCKF